LRRRELLCQKGKRGGKASPYAKERRSVGRGKGRGGNLITELGSLNHSYKGGKGRLRSGNWNLKLKRGYVVFPLKAMIDKQKK